MVRRVEESKRGRGREREGEGGRDGEGERERESKRERERERECGLRIVWHVKGEEFSIAFYEIMKVAR